MLSALTPLQERAFQLLGIKLHRAPELTAAATRETYSLAACFSR